MKITLTIEVWKKEAWYVAKCPELDFVAQGKDAEEARANLLEVMETLYQIYGVDSVGFEE